MASPLVPRLASAACMRRSTSGVACSCMRDIADSSGRTVSLQSTPGAETLAQRYPTRCAARVEDLLRFERGHEVLSLVGRRQTLVGILAEMQSTDGPTEREEPVSVGDEHARNGAVGADVILEDDVRDASVAERTAGSAQHAKLGAFDVE